LLLLKFRLDPGEFFVGVLPVIIKFFDVRFNIVASTIVDFGNRYFACV